MKVKKLIKILSDKDPNAEVIISSDGEGNTFNILCITTEAFYHRERDEFGWSDIELFDEDDEDRPKSSKKAVVLFPS